MINAALHHSEPNEGVLPRLIPPSMNLEMFDMVGPTYRDMF